MYQGWFFCVSHMPHASRASKRQSDGSRADGYSCSFGPYARNGLQQYGRWLLPYEAVPVLSSRRVWRRLNANRPGTRARVWVSALLLFVPSVE